jgi:hypothetical protein
MEEGKFLYAYYYTGGNHRMITLIPEPEIIQSNFELRDLEGFLETKIPLRLNNDRRIVRSGETSMFSITFKEEIAKEYQGKYTKINRDFNIDKRKKYFDYQ